MVSLPRRCRLREETPCLVMLWPEEVGTTFIFGENQDHKMSYCEVGFGSFQKGFFLQLDPCQLTPEVGVGFIMRQGIPFTRGFQREGTNCFLVLHVVEEIHASEKVAVFDTDRI